VSPGKSHGPIVIDTDVFSADLVPGSRLTELYAPIITGRPAFISFQTAAELRYGALRRGWGEARMLRLDAKIAMAEVVHSGPELVQVYARLRADCEAQGHALGQREHDADRWIASTALRLGCRLSPTTGSFETFPAWTSRCSLALNCWKSCIIALYRGPDR
jgi:predicted nucleic acid-binding protein